VRATGEEGEGESDGEDNGHTKVARSSFYEGGMRYRFKFLNSHAVQLWHDGRTGRRKTRWHCTVRETATGPT
jgi:hypothetical protein